MTMWTAAVAVAMLCPMGTDRELAAPPARLRMLGRALARRCLLCGSRGIFRGWFSLVACCPGCRYGFEREEGYWVGAMIMNTVVTYAAFFAVFLGGLAVTWPAVPWTGLLLAGLAVMGLVPLGFYPYSKTLWLWVDLQVNPARAPARGG